MSEESPVETVENLLRSVEPAIKVVASESHAKKGKEKTSDHSNNGMEAFGPRCALWKGMDIAVLEDAVKHVIRTGALKSSKLHGLSKVDAPCVSPVEVPLE